MTTLTNVTTEVVLELTHQDIVDCLRHLKAIPDDWQYFSMDVKGNGLSRGATITLQRKESKKP